jgi:hypothetical protein
MIAVQKAKNFLVEILLCKYEHEQITHGIKNLEVNKVRKVLLCCRKQSD